MNVYVSELTLKNKGISFILNEGRQAYIFCFEGGININQYSSIKERDSLKIYGQANMELTLTSDKAHFIIIEMQQEKSD
ncbi:MAG: hypothetical protein L0922_05975 [Candidatus Mariimomonas ferrooxydans]